MKIARKCTLAYLHLANLLSGDYLVGDDGFAVSFSTHANILHPIAYTRLPSEIVTYSSDVCIYVQASCGEGHTSLLRSL